MQVEEIFIWEYNESKRHAPLRQICINLHNCQVFETRDTQLVKIQPKLFIEKKNIFNIVL